MCLIRLTFTECLRCGSRCVRCKEKSYDLLYHDFVHVKKVSNAIKPLDPAL